ncbi:unnamed protein product [Rangifer tarandus platyrhynchus]|uniref:Uncharacterized protein n=3 Tax=Rangifer tarandus platyrhynchus TaxID=3082113 RepID=A0ACB0FNN0_RANTA|nr:unnamed protein product [Rangifer tarandus platyrhynchus]CAI9714339.1 unnamed protein product [Rangifer tarandus platyrhynchus]
MNSSGPSPPVVVGLGGRVLRYQALSYWGLKHAKGGALEASGDQVIREDSSVMAERCTRPRACPLFSVADPQPFYKQVILVTKDAARAGRKVGERPQRRGKHIAPGRPFLGSRVWPRGRHVGRRGGPAAPCVSLARQGGRVPRTVREAGSGSDGRPRVVLRLRVSPQDSGGGGGDTLGGVHGIRFK